MNLKKNMGMIDRVARVALALVVAVLIFTQAISGLLATILGIFAVIFVLTSTVSFCPSYLLVNLSTRKE